MDRIDQDWVDRHVGIICEQCGSEALLLEAERKLTKVTHTKKGDDEIWRRRKCRICGHIMETVERRVI
jgi:transcriptional regulator NrdR family protein